MIQLLLSTVATVFLCVLWIAILDYFNTGHWSKRYFIGYPMTVITFNFWGLISWVCLMVFDIFIAFFRLLYSMIINEPGQSGEISPYLSGNIAMDVSFNFMMIMGNVIALKTIIDSEVDARSERRWEKKKRLMEAQYEENIIHNKPKNIYETMNEDLQSFSYVSNSLENQNKK